ncbi:MAG TPA: hypothetical protein VEW08_03300 [Steroidobacteraceae bacterium]|nr:hypothetical protein [Steroidobacteraceae bacterium]
MRRLDLFAQFHQAVVATLVSANNPVDWGGGLLALLKAVGPGS